MITASQWARIESLGDNCELGGVLRKAGNETGGFFRWTLCPLKGVRQVIAEDFANVYELQNLKPHTKSMVMDTANGIAFHSEMRAVGELGAMVFTTPADEMAEIQKREQSKAVYMGGKFLKRLQDPSVLFVTKRNFGLPLEDVVDFHDFLKKKAGSDRINLLWVQTAKDPSRVGVIESIGDSGLITGYIPGFAKYADALGGDFQSWVGLLQGAFDVVDGKSADSTQEPALSMAPS